MDTVVLGSSGARQQEDTGKLYCFIPVTQTEVDVMNEQYLFGGDD